MPLETVGANAKIDALDANNPIGSDSLEHADEHLRNIKRALKNTFPHQDTTGESLDISQQELIDGLIPVGAGLPWFGTWQQLDDFLMTHTNWAWHDMAGRFLIGGKRDGTDWGETGLSNDVELTVPKQNITSDEHVMQMAELVQHDHGIDMRGANLSSTQYTDAPLYGQAGANKDETALTASTGTNPPAGHSHTLTVAEAKLTFNLTDGMMMATGFVVRVA